MARSRTAVWAAGLALLATPPVPAWAGSGAVHDVSVEEYDASEFVPAEENFCGAWDMTFHEVRSGAYQLVTAPGGREEGEVHVNGSIAGFVELTPSNPTLPSYTGTYREKVNAILIGVDDRGFDVLRSGQYRLRLPLQGTDGSSLLLLLSGKLTVNARWEVTVSRDVVTCE